MKGAARVSYVYLSERMALDLQIPCLAKVALPGIAAARGTRVMGPLKRVVCELVKTGKAKRR